MRLQRWDSRIEWESDGNVFFQNWTITVLMVICLHLNVIFLMLQLKTFSESHNVSSPLFLLFCAYKWEFEPLCTKFFFLLIPQRITLSRFEWSHKRSVEQPAEETFDGCHGHLLLQLFGRTNNPSPRPRFQSAGFFVV